MEIENTTDIEVYNDTAYAPTKTDWNADMNDGSDEEEIQWFPRLKLLQPTSIEVKSEGEKEGTWIVDGYASLGEKVTVIPFAIANTRILFDQDEQETLCRSENGKVGIGNPGGNCKECPMAEWGEDKTPPKCIARRSFVLYIPEIQDWAQWDAAKTAYRTGSRLRQLYRAKYPNSVFVTLSSTLVSKKMYTYYVPNLKTIIDEEIIDSIDLPSQDSLRMILPGDGNGN